MARNEVLQGMQDLINGLKEYNIGKAIGTARQKLDELASKDLNEFDRRAAQNAIAHSTAQAILGFGGTAEAAQQARLGFAPQELNLQEAQLQATGAPTVSGAVQALNKQNEAAKIREEQRQLQGQLQLQQLRNEGAQGKSDARVEAQTNAPRKFSSADIKTLNMDKSGAANFNNVARTIEAMPPERLAKLTVLPDNALSGEERKAKTLIGRVLTVDRHELFGSALTGTENQKFDEVQGTLSSGIVNPKAWAQSFRTVGELYKNSYLRKIDDFAAANVGREQDINRFVISAQSSLGLSPEETQNYLNRRTKLQQQIDQNVNRAPAQQAPQPSQSSPSAPAARGYNVKWD